MRSGSLGALRRGWLLYLATLSKNTGSLQHLLSSKKVTIGLYRWIVGTTTLSSETLIQVWGLQDPRREWSHRKMSEYIDGQGYFRSIPSYLSPLFYHEANIISFLGILQQSPTWFCQHLFLFNLASTFTNKVIFIKYKSDHFTPQPNPSNNPY